MALRCIKASFYLLLLQMYQFSALGMKFLYKCTCKTWLILKKQGKYNFDTSYNQKYHVLIFNLVINYHFSFYC